MLNFHITPNAIAKIVLAVIFLFSAVFLFLFYFWVSYIRIYGIKELQSLFKENLENKKKLLIKLGMIKEEININEDKNIDVKKQHSPDTLSNDKISKNVIQTDL